MVVCRLPFEYLQHFEHGDRVRRSPRTASRARVRRGSKEERTT